MQINNLCLFRGNDYASPYFLSASNIWFSMTHNALLLQILTFICFNCCSTCLFSVYDTCQNYNNVNGGKKIQWTNTNLWLSGGVAVWIFVLTALFELLCSGGSVSVDEGRDAVVHPHPFVIREDHRHKIISWHQKNVSTRILLFAIWQIKTEHVLVISNVWL